MAIVGFSFTRIIAEKYAPVRGKVNIVNNVQALSVSDAQISMGSGKKGIRVQFLFESKYEPKIGLISLEGDILLLEDAKFADLVLESWKKEHALPKEILMAVLNHALDRCNVEALILSRDLSLPSPVPLPKVNISQAKPEAKAAAPAKKEKPKKK